MKRRIAALFIGILILVACGTIPASAVSLPESIQSAPTGLVSGDTVEQTRHTLDLPLWFVGTLRITLVFNPFHVWVSLDSNYKLFTFLTSSMSPTIKNGNWILVKKVSFEEIQIGDIITFNIDDSNYITHRVVGIEEQDGERQLVTKGDANAQEDLPRVTKDQEVWRLVWVIPI